ncbi:MAG: YidC/Oxa1 family membrane protein insertase [Clostridiales bacterium]|nr:YidC/Oxa1 family membrane protein insertase [Clostridiales bacterium]
MTFLTALYTLIIYPIELLFEIVFSIIFKSSGNAVISIIILSLAFNLVVLPLYRRADSIQEEAREKEIKLAPVIKHIRESFKGDERFMILQTYYRQNDYSPMNVLKSSVSLLLQIPFFIAAYRMLSGCSILSGAAAGPVKDLSAPDGLLVIGGIAINVLPVIMTLVNIVSGVIYGKGMPLRSKLQMYLIAAVFLVFLYNSPSGLVFYWTLNNIFSLGKNIVMVVMREKKAGKAVTEKKTATKTDKTAASRNNALFIASAVFLALFTGFFIPTNVLSASPQQFMNRYTMSNPAFYLLYPVLTGTGLFVLWAGLFYYLASPKGRTIMSRVMFVFCAGALFNNTLFSNYFGDMVETLQYVHSPVFETENMILDAVFLLFAVLLCLIITKFTKSFPAVLAGCGAAALLIISFGNISKINDQYRLAFNSYSEKPSFELSKDGQNVVVIMLDRAVGSMVPYIMNEKPELKESFDGFTWYHNSLSYGQSTNFASPALYGGYDYTPEKINERSNESLVNKQNECLKVMPSVFANAGWDCTFINPTYAGYSWIPDLTVFKDFKGLSVYNTGYHYIPNLPVKCANLESALCRNLYCYSLFKSCPVAVQPLLYDDGKYNMTGSMTGEERSSFQVVDGTSRALGHYLSFEAEYYALKSMTSMTKISDSGNNMVIMANKSTHDMSMLSEPEYEPKYYIDNTEYDNTHKERFVLNGKALRMENVSQYEFYEMNMAAFMSLSKWFDYLKEQGVYDNTRIIIVSDHAYGVGQYDELLFNNDGADFDAQGFIPLLMVKDFGSTGFNVSEEFMTNADTPALATQGLIDNAVNPFTGNPLSDPEKKKGPQKVIFSGAWDVLTNGTNTFDRSQWYSVRDNVWERSNWKYEGYK